jgi:tol-pal system protein YbgF
MLVLSTLVGSVGAQSLSTGERLDLLERRAARITELTLQMDEMRRENRELRGAVEQLSHQIEQLKRQQRDLYLDIDQRLSGMQPGAAPAASAAEPTASADPVATPRPPAATTDRAQIRAEYDAAYALLSPQQKRYDEAAKAFSRFLERHPDDELAPNARYWLGEAYYVSQQNKPALQAFEQVVSEHPNDAKAPGALFKIGRIKEATGDRAGARAAYQRVLKDYPNAPAAGLSSQRLKQLGG